MDAGTAQVVYHQKASPDWGWDRYVCIDRLHWGTDGQLSFDPTPMRVAIVSERSAAGGGRP
jgi:hypothetical protein